MFIILHVFKAMTKNSWTEWLCQEITWTNMNNVLISFTKTLNFWTSLTKPNFKFFIFFLRECVKIIYLSQTIINSWLVLSWFSFHFQAKVNFTWPVTLWRRTIIYNPRIQEHSTKMHEFSKEKSSGQEK